MKLWTTMTLWIARSFDGTSGALWGMSISTGAGKSPASRSHLVESIQVPLLSRRRVKNQQEDSSCTRFELRGHRSTLKQGQKGRPRKPFELPCSLRAETPVRACCCCSRKLASLPSQVMCMSCTCVRNTS